MFDVLCAQFFLLTLLFLTFFLEARRPVFYIASLLTAILAILSKENAFTLPVIVLAFALVWFWKKGFSLKRLFSAAIVCLPYLLIYVCYIMIRIEFLKSYGAVTPFNLSDFYPLALYEKYRILLRVLIIPYYGNSSISEVQAFALRVLLVLLTLCFLWKKESRRAITFGAIWIFVTVIPTLLFVAVGPQRLNYLPSIGFCMILAQITVTLSIVFRTKRVAPLLPCAVVAFYAVNTIFHGHYWMEGWRTSRDMQESFQTEVAPILKKPARAYFFGIPEIVNGVTYFTTGLPECFSLISKEKNSHYHVAYQWTRPHVPYPEQAVCEEGLSSYYCFEWDPSGRRFRQVGTVLHDRQASGSDIISPYSWDFSKYSDYYQWEPARDLVVFFDRNTKSHKFLTTGEYSFLKSPYMNKRIKCVQINCRVTNPDNAPLTGRLFWVTESQLDYDGRKCITFPVVNDESLHTYTLPLYWNAWAVREPIVRFALRLSDQPGTMIDVNTVTMYSY
jgi:hypothetical protein